MNQKELKELIEFLKEQDIAEFELERGDVKVRIKRALPSTPVEPHYLAVPTVSPTTVGIPSPLTAPSQSPIPEPPKPAPEDDFHPVRSPIVGTFYEAPSPGAPPFIKLGDFVEVGQVLCIVEAMKLMNEIESDIAGEVVKKLVNNGQPIEYGQELFLIRPKK